MANLIVIQGSSTVCDKLALKEFTDYSSADWVAHVYVAESLGGARLISRPLEKAIDSSGFLAYLRPAETLGLPSNADYALAYVLTNLTLLPQINHEVQHVLRVAPKT